MSAKGHTPGPWNYDDTQKFVQGRVIRHNGVLVCKVIDQITTDTMEVEANARLIKAAPKLLQACRAALAVVVYDGDRPVWELDGPTVAMIRGAVEEAEEVSRG